jgi:hypothetical protein
MNPAYSGHGWGRRKKKERDYLAWKEWLFGGPDGGSRRETGGGIGIGVGG